MRMNKSQGLKVFVIGDNKNDLVPSALSNYGGCDVYYFPQEQTSVVELMDYAPDVIIDSKKNNLVECYKM